MSDLGIDLRKATLDDARLLFAWRNDETSRGASRNTEELEFGGHLQWLERALSNPDRRLLIAEADGKAVGMIRADNDKQSDRTLLSWAIAPECRGLGHGKRMLAKFLQTYSGRYRADIRQGNLPSENMVKRLGFHISGTSEGFTCWHRET